MLCPWQTVTIEETDVYRKKRTETKFADCVGRACPFHEKLSCVIDGVPSYKERCKRAICEASN